MEEKIYQEAQKKIEEIEQEMKRCGAWSDKPFDEKPLENMGPFGMNTMPFERWLQYVLIPKVHEEIKNRNFPPGRSTIATKAVREFDGRDEYIPLTNLLWEFDKLFPGNPEIYKAQDRKKRILSALMLVIVGSTLIFYIFSK